MAAAVELTGKVMFIITSDAGCTGNDRLERYADDRRMAAKAFIAPSGESLGYVTVRPKCFDARSTSWVAIYNFEWVDGDHDDGECDGTPCFQVPAAHDRHYLTRVWDVDDSVEFDMAFRRFWGGQFGAANFIPVDRPWQIGGDGGAGLYQFGVYPW